MSAKVECNRTEHAGTQIYFTVSCESQNSSIFISDLSVSTTCSPLHSKFFLSEHRTFQCNSHGLDLLLIPLVIKKNLFALSNVSLGYGETNPLQTAVLTAEVTAAQHHHAPGMLCTFPCQHSQEGAHSSSQVGSRSLLSLLSEYSRLSITAVGPVASSHPPVQAPCRREE